MKISGSTRFCFIVGTPVTQVKTPAVFNAWAARTGVDVMMLPVDVPPDGIARLLAAMRDWENCCGCVITVPHKQAAYALLDHADAQARFGTACNVIRREADGRLSGTMTDGTGFAEAVKRHGRDFTGKSMLLVGAGGAGSAIAYEAAQRGLARLVARDIDRARLVTLTRRLREAFPRLDIATEMPERQDFDLACNASTAGMDSDTTVPFDVTTLPDRCLVCDAVTKPELTPLLEAARARGLAIQRGREMVEAQFPRLASHLLGFDVAAARSMSDGS